MCCDESFGDRPLAMLDALGVGRQGDHGDRSRGRVRLEPAVDLPAVDAELAEVEIQQDQVGAFRPRQGQPRLTVAGLEQAVLVVFLEPASDELGDLGLVLDVEDLRPWTFSCSGGDVRL